MIRGAALLAAGAVALIVSSLLTDSIDGATPPVRPPPSAYEQLTGRLAAEASIAASFARAQPKSWLQAAEEGVAHLRYAQITGDYEAYARADTAVARSFVHAGEGYGPFLLRATLNGSLHRFDRVRADLDRVQPEPFSGDEQDVVVLGLRADLDLQQGRYREAFAGYTRALALRRDAVGLARLAYLAFRTGDTGRAEGGYVEALAATPPADGQTRAWVLLQRALMDLELGRVELAGARLRQADRAFPGWWVVEHHLAELDVRERRVDRAIERTRDLVRRTGDPELMDGLADLLRRRGAAREASQWVVNARAVYAERLARFPEATYGHALGHFLTVEVDPARALDLARRNHALRPGGEAKTWLAQAHLLAGDVASARRLVDEVLSTPWRSAATSATAALVYERAGDPAAAAAQRRDALARSPEALDRLAWLAAGR